MCDILHRTQWAFKATWLRLPLLAVTEDSHCYSGLLVLSHHLPWLCSSVWHSEPPNPPLHPPRAGSFRLCTLTVLSVSESMCKLVPNLIMLLMAVLSYCLSSTMLCPEVDLMAFVCLVVFLTTSCLSAQKTQFRKFRKTLLFLDFHTKNFIFAANVYWFSVFLTANYWCKPSKKHQCTPNPENTNVCCSKCYLISVGLLDF